jgi:hypothetical protein
MRCRAPLPREWEEALTCGSKRVEKQIKDAEDKSDELKGHVSYYLLWKIAGNANLRADHTSTVGRPATGSRTSTTSSCLILV